MHVIIIMAQLASNNRQEVEKSKSLSKPRIFSGLFLIFLSLVFSISFISYLINWKANQSQAGAMLDREIKSSNLFGKFGDWLGNIFIFDSIGIAAFLIAFLMLVLGFQILKKPYFKLWKTISHSLFFICWLPIFMGAITKGNGTLSGVFGNEIQDYLASIIGNFGLWVTLISSMLLYFVLEFNLRPSSIQDKYDTIKNKFSTQDADSETDFLADISLKEEHQSLENLKVTTEIEAPHRQNIEPIKTPNQTSSVNHTPAINPTIGLPVEKDAESVSFHFDKEENPEEVTITTKEEIAFSIEEKKEELSDFDQKAKDLVAQHGEYDHKLDLANFQMPKIELLKEYGNEEIAINKDELEENKNKIVGLLKNFNVGISEIKATIGPTVTLYEIVPEAGIRVSAIKKLQDDIALNLSALGIRIIAPMPGKGTIGIEVPRKKPSMVSMRSVIASPKFQNTDMDLPVVFGKTISNEVFVADLAKMPHLLMAGATGQGKSVGINAILTSLLYKKHPSELKFVMVDPKKVELSLYSKIERHYLAKLPDGEDAIITDTHKVINTLNSLCIEMDNRYDLLKNAFCKNLKEYNKKFTERKLNPENGHRYMPYIVLVVDEFADLIMTAGKEVELPIARLAQLARAVGIHLIVATQRPSVNVITGMIKANFPARAAFRVISSVDSRTILDSPGADQLIGKGDMLYFNGNEILRLQCAFVDTPEVEKIAEYIGEQKGYATAFMLPEYNGEENTSTVAAFDPNEKDQLFEEAARIIVSSQQGSTSMLQRQLKLGYNRAGRIMDQLEAAGIVGGFNGAKAREVMVSDLHALESFLEELRK